MFFGPIIDFHRDIKSKRTDTEFRYVRTLAQVEDGPVLVLVSKDGRYWKDFCGNIIEDPFYADGDPTVVIKTT